MKESLVLLSLFLLSSIVYAEEYPLLKSEAEYKSDAQEICMKEWTKRGELDYRMYEYCLEQQMDGYIKLLNFHQYLSKDFYSKFAYPYCIKKWTKRGVVDTRMLAHCLEQEVEGFKDVIYYKEKYDKQAVGRIAKRALSMYGSWNMAAYSVKKAVD